MIKKFLSPPHFEDEDENFRAQFINGFGLILMSLLAVSIVPQALDPTADYTLFVLFGLIGVMLLSLYILHRGYVRVSGILIVVLTWLGITVQAATAEGVRDVIVVGYIAVSLLASLIINWRIGTFVIAGSVGAVWVLSLLQVNGWITPVVEPPLSFAR